MPQIEGGAPDLDCLHCVLAARVEAHLLSHPSVDIRQHIGELVQLTAEVIASRVPEPEIPAILGMMRVVLVKETANALVAYKRRGLRAGVPDG